MFQAREENLYSRLVELILYVLLVMFADKTLNYKNRQSGPKSMGGVDFRVVRGSLAATCVVSVATGMTD